MTTQRTQVRELPDGAPDLRDIATGDIMARGTSDSKADSTRDHTDLAGLQEELTQLRLDVQVAQLRNNQEVTVRVAECPMVHIRVDHEHIQRNPFAQVWVATPTQGVQPVNEVDLLILVGKRERQPFSLFSKCFNFRVQRK